jgi:hypothetical protein
MEKCTQGARKTCDPPESAGIRFLEHGGKSIAFQPDNQLQLHTALPGERFRAPNQVAEIDPYALPKRNQRARGGNQGIWIIR